METCCFIRQEEQEYVIEEAAAAGEPAISLNDDLPAASEQTFAHAINDLMTTQADIDHVFTSLPNDIKLKLTSDEFAETCQENFAALDTDGNGVLTPDELFPIV